MSLEKVVADLHTAVTALTVAVIANTDAIRGNPLPAPGHSDPKAIASTTKGTAKPKDTPPAGVPPAATPPAPAAVNAEGEAPGYTPVKKAFLDLVQAKGRDAALAAIAPLPALNVVKGGEQTPGQYALLLAAITTAGANAAAASLV